MPACVAALIFAAAGGDAAAFATSARLLLALAVTASLAAGVRGMLFSVLNYRMVARLRARLFAALVRTDMEFFDRCVHGRGGRADHSACDGAVRARCVC